MKIIIYTTESTVYMEVPSEEEANIECQRFEGQMWKEVRAVAVISDTGEFLGVQHDSENFMDQPPLPSPHLQRPKWNRTTQEWEEGITPEQVISGIKREIRDMRGVLLSACDWTQLSDSPLSTEKKLEWKVYRQLLRDLPSMITTPTDVVWPTKPV